MSDYLDRHQQGYTFFVYNSHVTNSNVEDNSHLTDNINFTKVDSSNMHVSANCPQISHYSLKISTNAASPSVL